MNSDFKWAMVGDLQIPYHDPRAVALWFKVMKWWKPNAIDIVGDIDDQLEYSSFSDGTTDEFMSVLKKMKPEPEESTEDFQQRSSPLGMIKANAEGARTFYQQVRAEHPNADIHASLGNHEERVFNYVDKKTPEVLEFVTPNMLWSLDDLGITWRRYKVPPFERFAGIRVHHGATISSAGLAVKADIESYNVSLIRGHDHRGGVVYKTYPMTGGSLVGMGTGHMCDPAGYGLQYTVNPSWEKGFGLAHVVDGKAHLQFIPIRTTDKGLCCVVDGKVFYN